MITYAALQSSCLQEKQIIKQCKTTILNKCLCSLQNRIFFLHQSSVMPFFKFILELCFKQESSLLLD